MLPDGHVDRVGEVVAVRNVLDDAILSLELLHSSIAEILCWRVINTEVELVFLLELFAALSGTSDSMRLASAMPSRLGLVASDEELKCLSQTELTHGQRAVLHS
jgi:hypothetical protein